MQLRSVEFDQLPRAAQFIKRGQEQTFNDRLCQHLVEMYSFIYNLMTRCEKTSEDSN